MIKEKNWFENEEDWVIKQSIIFNKDLVRLTFLEVRRLLKLLDIGDTRKKLLDLCCGIGRHSLEFARQGLDVTSVDITQSYLTIAKQNAEKEGLPINFIRSDMKDFCQPDSFDVITNLCTSFGYFDDINDDLQVLENVYSSLKEGGKFLIEILGKEVIARNFKEKEELQFEGYDVLCESRILNNWDKLECIRTISKDSVSKKVTAYHRLYSAKELTGYMSDIGFKNLQVYGNFIGDPYDNKAKSMIIIGCK